MNLSEMKMFLKHFDRVNDDVCIQVFPEGASTGKAEHKFGSFTELSAWIISENKNGKGVFFSVNQTNGLGRKAENIKKIRAVFADFDDVSRDNLKYIEQLPLRPQLIVESSPGKYHAYWKVHDCPLDQFKPVQQAIAKKLNSDISVCDLGRVMRLPGTLHKKSAPFLVRLVKPLAGNVPPPPYSLNQIISTLGLDVYPEDSQQEFEDSCISIPILKSDDIVLEELLGFETCSTNDTGKASFLQLFNAEIEALAHFFPDKTGKNKYNASSADLALCCKFARATDCNPAQMDRLFRRTKLYRPKWKRKDYRERTIKKAIESYRRLATNSSGDLGFDDEAELTPFESFNVQKGIVGHDNHVETAIYLLSKVFKGRLKKYENDFIWWAGLFYQTVDKSDVRCKIGIALSKTGKATQSNINSQTDTLLDHAEKVEQINPPALKIFFKNGVYDIEQKKLVPHQQSNNNTRTLNVYFDPHAEAPKFSSWLIDIFSNNPKNIELLQEIFGYCLFRGNLGIEKAILIVGPQRAGKGTLGDLISKIIGEAHVSFNLNDLHDGKQINTLRHAQVGIDAEAVGPESRHAKEVLSRFKGITSNDFLSTPIIYQARTWNGKVNCKLVVIANTTPYLHDDSGAAANRWVPLVFDKSFSGKEDPNLKSKFDDELAGIAMWAFKGLLRLVERGHFDLPQISKDTLANMLFESGSIQDFLSSRCRIGSGLRCSDSVLYFTYNQWCFECRQKPRSRSSFLRAVEDTSRALGVTKKSSIRIGDSNPVRGFDGLEVIQVTCTSDKAPEPPKATRMYTDDIPPPPPASH